MKLARALALATLSIVLLAGGTTAAAASDSAAASGSAMAAPAEKPEAAAPEIAPFTSKALNGSEVASTHDTSQLTQEQIKNARITDPKHASKSFYGINPDCPNPGLLDIDGWKTMEPGAAAQAVQGSGHPDAYDKWEPLAGELVDENQDVTPIK